jgi:uncharacterized oligopeptide transporter (OPT) family protein
MKARKYLLGLPYLTWRSITLTALGSIIITVSSIYVALRLSALPWPTIFVAVFSMSLLKLLGNTNLQEINITQTGMSSGAMVAGGIAFTIPGLWISGIFTPFDPAVQTLSEWLLPKLWPVLLVSLIGVLLGTMLCWFYRKRNIETMQLAYPIGTAAAETLDAGDEGGRKSYFLFGALGLAAIFTVLRDKLAMIPQNLESRLGSFPLQLYASPMAIGIGYIIGFPGAAYWMLGGLISHYGLQKLGLELGTFTDEASVSAFILTTAVGLMVGSGVGILIQFLKTIKWKRGLVDKNQEPAQNLLRNRDSLFALIVVAVSFVLSILLGLSPLVAVLLMAGVIFATMMSSVITGQTGINPMEVFGIIVLLAVRLFVRVDDIQAFLIAAIVAVACGYAGDAMNDYKTGAILGTDARAQFVTQFLGGFVGVFAAVFGLFVLILQYGGVGGNTGLTAAQAHSVTALVNGIGDPVVFGLALLVGVLLYVNGVPAMIIGIGMILSLGMATAIFLGGLTSVMVRKFVKNEEATNVGNVISAGLLGGEGITGTILAFVAMFMK